jgi:VWFA-related protein
MILFDEAPIRHAVNSHARRPSHLILGLCLVTFLVASHTNAYSQDDSETEVVRVRTDHVTAPVFVTDSRGNRVMNLTAVDFEVRDNGRIVKIEYFSVGAERVALAFVLDASGSIRDVITRQREVALALLTRFGGGSEIAVVRFAEKSRIVAPFSTDPNAAMRAFDLPALENHKTAIFDAVATTIRTFAARRVDVAERRIIVLISDGLDTASTTRPRDVIDIAKDRGVSVYAIQIPLYAPQNGRLRPRSASKGFRDIAEKSGGQFFLAGNAESPLAPQTSYDLSPIFKAIEDDLRGQYVLGYYPDAETQDGRFHRIDIKLTSKEKRKLRVHSLREGYTSAK